MRMILKVAYFCLALCLSASVRANQDSLSDLKHDLRLYTNLQEKMKKRVQTYNGFMFNVLVIKNKPVINVNFVQVDSDPNNQSTSKMLLMANSNVSHADRQAYGSKLASLKGRKVGKVRLVEDSGRGNREERELIKFNSYDERGNLICSEHFDEDTGFKVKQVIFDKQEKIVCVIFFYKLEINERPKRTDFGDLQIISVEKFLSSKMDFESLRDIEEFSESVFDKVIY